MVLGRGWENPSDNSGTEPQGNAEAIHLEILTRAKYAGVSLPDTVREFT